MARKSSGGIQNFAAMKIPGAEPQGIIGVRFTHSVTPLCGVVLDLH